jgi:hypothetical protein
MKNTGASLDIVYASCCRIWPIARFNPIGKCKLCNEVPVVLPELSDEDYSSWKENQ